MVPRIKFACRSTQKQERKAAHSGHICCISRQALDGNKESKRFDSLDEVSNVVWQLLDDSVVETLNVLQQPLVILDDKVDGNTLAAKPS